MRTYGSILDHLSQREADAIEAAYSNARATATDARPVPGDLLRAYLDIRYWRSPSARARYMARRHL